MAQALALVPNTNMLLGLMTLESRYPWHTSISIRPTVDHPNVRVVSCDRRYPCTPELDLDEAGNTRPFYPWSRSINSLETRTS